MVGGRRLREDNEMKVLVFVRFERVLNQSPTRVATSRACVFLNFLVSKHPCLLDKDIPSFLVDFILSLDILAFV